MMEEKIKIAAAAVGGVCGYIWGAADGLLITLVTMMALDIFTGLIVATIRKEVSSKASYKGIGKKMLILGVVAVANLVDISLLGGGGVLRTAACCFYIVNEGISNIENAAKIGVPLPRKLIDTLNQLKEKTENEQEVENKDGENDD